MSKYDVQIIACSKYILSHNMTPFYGPNVIGQNLLYNHAKTSTLSVSIKKPNYVTVTVNLSMSYAFLRYIFILVRSHIFTPYDNFDV